MFLYSSELIPTVFRCTGFLLLGAAGRIGPILGIQVMKLDTEEMPWISGTVFGVITLITAYINSTLPETRNIGLTQTLAEAECKLTQIKEEK